MCPACMASATVIAGSVMSTGGITALALRLIRSKKNGSEKNSQKDMERSNEHGNDDK